MSPSSLAGSDAESLASDQTLYPEYPKEFEPPLPIPETAWDQARREKSPARKDEVLDDCGTGITHLIPRHETFGESVGRWAQDDAAQSSSCPSLSTSLVTRSDTDTCGDEGFSDSLGRDDDDYHYNPSSRLGLSSQHRSGNKCSSAEHDSHATKARDESRQDDLLPKSSLQIRGICKTGDYAALSLVIGALQTRRRRQNSSSEDIKAKLYSFCEGDDFKAKFYNAHLHTRLSLSAAEEFRDAQHESFRQANHQLFDLLPGLQHKELLKLYIGQMLYLREQHTRVPWSALSQLALRRSIGQAPGRATQLLLLKGQTTTKVGSESNATGAPILDASQSDFVPLDTIRLRRTVAPTHAWPDNRLSGNDYLGGYAEFVAQNLCRDTPFDSHSDVESHDKESVSNASTGSQDDQDWNSRRDDSDISDISSSSSGDEKPNHIDDTEDTAIDELTRRICGKVLSLMASSPPKLLIQVVERKVRCFVTEVFRNSMSVSLQSSGGRTWYRTMSASDDSAANSPTSTSFQAPSSTDQRDRESGGHEGNQDSTSNGQRNGGKREGQGDRPPTSDKTNGPGAGYSSYCCPFYIRNPERFNARISPGCANKQWVKLSLLKRHIRSVHQRKSDLPFRCSRCKEGFPTNESLERHIENTSAVPCRVVRQSELARNKPNNPEDGLSAKALQILDSRKADVKIKSWDSLWHLLFPEDGVPPLPYLPPTGVQEIKHSFQEREPDLTKAVNRTVDDTLREYGIGEEKTSDLARQIASLFSEHVRITLQGLRGCDMRSVPSGPSSSIQSGSSPRSERSNTNEPDTLPSGKKRKLSLTETVSSVDDWSSANSEHHHPQISLTSPDGLLLSPDFRPRAKPLSF